MDDENPTEVTAGAIVTVIVTLTRKHMSVLFGNDSDQLSIENGQESQIGEQTGDGVSESEAKNDSKEKRPVWLKQKRGGGGKKQKKQAIKAKPGYKPQKTEEEEPVTTAVVEKKPKVKEADEESNNGDESEALEDDESSDSGQKSYEEDDQEWEKLKKLTDRDKSLEGRSKTSHPVHCPYFPHDKQEYWWTYISDKKSKTLLTMPHFVTSLVEQEEIHLKFTAPKWPAVYSFTASLCSDSYIGFNQQKEFKLDVKEAPKIPEQHPQWEFEDSDDGKEDKEENHESDYTTDEDYAEDD